MCPAAHNIGTLIISSCSNEKRRSTKISIEKFVLKGILISARMSTLSKEYQGETLERPRNNLQKIFHIGGIVLITRWRIVYE